MIPGDLLPWLTATRRRQRVALIVALSPFYVAFAAGWMGRSPFPLFAGAIGGGLIMLAYRVLAKPHPAPSEPQPTEALGEDE